MLFLFLVEKVNSNVMMWLSQIIEYDDLKNDSQLLEYEEYAAYDDHFGPAEREGAQTWGGEVCA